MAFAFPSPDHLPCPDCGASVPVTGDAGLHICDNETRLDYQLHELGPEIERFSEELAHWLNSPEGRFQQWLAERER
jgi:hypothetical protein